TNGSLDSTFGSSGKVITDIGTHDDFVSSIMVQSDGKILVAGTNGFADPTFALYRYDTNGLLDTSFGTNGTLTTDIGAGNDEGKSATLQSDGKILVAGYSHNGTDNDFALVRYNADGSLDTDFDSISTLDGNPTFIEDGTPEVLDADVEIRDTELDALNGGSGNYDGASVTLARNGGANGEDVFSETGTLSALTEGASFNLGGLTIGRVTTNSAGTLVLSFNTNATTALVNSAMQQIAYSNSSDAPPVSAQIDWSFDDGNTTDSQGTGGALQATGSTTVTITPENDEPVVTASGGVTSYSEQATATVIDSAITITDPDGYDGTDPSDQYNANIKITGNYEATDILGFSDTANIQGNQVGDTLILSVIGGQTASVAEFQAAIRTVTFYNSSDTPSELDRTISFYFDDGVDASIASTKTVQVTPVNDAPSFGDENSPTTFYDHTIATGSDFRNTQSKIFSIDLDQDGYMDVLANTWRSGELVWFENDNGTGNFIEHNIDMPGATGRFTDIYSADINDDTYLDLVVVTSTQLSWLKNDSNQSFSWQLIDSLGDGLSSVSATDFDGDGHMEIVSASSNNDTIAWYKNNNESFTRNVLTSTAEGAATVVTADVDSDGFMDIVYASSDDDTVAWYQYLGGDTFSTENIVTTTSDGAYGVTVADMDSDGHMDLVVTAARIDDNAIELYENNDDQTFTRHIIGNKVTNPTIWPVATGDFDGDGDLDVVAPFPELDQMSWYENTGGHSYTEHMFTQNVYTAKSIAVADINNDGKLDVLSASYFDNKIAWHENITTTLDGVPDYTEDDPPVVLDADVEIFDAELSALANFDGSSLTLVRDGGTNGDDLFSATGTLVDLTEGVNLEVDSTLIGTVTTNTGGTLRLDFDSNATRSLVNSAMQQIAYSNSSDDPPISVRINWTFNDGNTVNQGSGGAEQVIGRTTISTHNVNDEPTLSATGSNPTFNEGGAAAGLFSGASVSTVEAGQSIRGYTFTVTNVTDTGNEQITIDGTTITLDDQESGTTNDFNYSVSVA
ncbi:MAG: hypothetical protein GY759_20685, partial [Chloroflexi bacterium]|nr:hypothetical protein [Chloroflexota bacterium]